MTDLELFKKALIEVEATSLLSIPKEINIIPSIHFLKQMKHLTNAQKHTYWRLINSPWKRVATIIIISLCLIGTSLSVNAIREPIIEFFVQIHETFTSFTISSNEQNAKLSKILHPTYIPEEFTEKYNYSDDYGADTVWQNDLGEEIEFVQNASNVVSTVDTENAQLETIIIDGVTFYICENKDIVTVIWNTGNESYRLHYSSSLDRTLMEEFIKGLK